MAIVIGRPAKATSLKVPLSVVVTTAPPAKLAAVMAPGGAL